MAATTTTTALVGPVLYGQEGPLPAGDLPRFCPPPVVGIDTSYWRSDDGEVYLGVWEEHGGARCYGVDGPYAACGDGYRDDGGWMGEGDCGGTVPVPGLPGAVEESRREAGPRDYVVGECIEEVRQNRVLLVDCRLPSVGRVVWADLRTTDPNRGRRACGLSNTAFPGFGRMLVVVEVGVAACLPLR